MKFVRLFSLLLVSLLLTSCPFTITPTRSDTGSIHFGFDLSFVAQARTFTPRAPDITAVMVTVSRSGYDDIVVDLSVSNNVATGQVTDLDPGYWHVVADVYEGATLIYTGASDVNVIAGATSTCVILFDPVEVPEETGTIDIIVGLNPLPGYMPLGIPTSQILATDTNVYVYDSSQAILAEYTEEMIRTQDFDLPGAPVAMCLSNSEDGAYVGYSNGDIYSLVFATGAYSLVGDVMSDMDEMVAFSDKYVLVQGSNLITFDVETGQIVDSYNSFYHYANFEPNHSLTTVYTHTIGVSPSDIHHIRLDAVTGEIIEDDDSIYHGDYSLGYPVRVVKNETRLLTANGSMFVCSALDEDDMTYAGNIGFSYYDAVADDAYGEIYLLARTSIPNLLLIDDTTDFVDLSIDLGGSPEHVVRTANSIIVFVDESGDKYARVFAKADYLP
jgi:hypothetical protein